MNGTVLILQANLPLDCGPLKRFALVLGNVKKKFGKNAENCPIRTYLVTARSAASSGLRALRVRYLIYCDFIPKNLVTRTSTIFCKLHYGLSEPIS